MRIEASADAVCNESNLALLLVTLVTLVASERHAGDASRLRVKEHLAGRIWELVKAPTSKWKKCNMWAKAMAIWSSSRTEAFSYEQNALFALSS